MLRAAAKDADSVADVLRALGRQQAGGTHAHISRLLKKHDIDTTHFTRNKRRAKTVRRIPPEELLVRLPPGSPRTNGQRLRRALLDLERPYVCAICGMGPSWQGRELVLQVDHIDGDLNNNDRNNLRFLCPNCHAQCPTFSRRPWQVAKSPTLLPERS